MISLQHVTLSLLHGKCLIEDLSFTLNPEDKLAIIGEEGNGKSSLIKTIYDANSVQSYLSIQGIISVENERIGYLKQILEESDLSLGAQDFLLLDSLDSNANLKEIYRYSSEFHLRSSILEHNTMVRVLSGGEKVKLQLIRLMLLHPSVLLLDEPSNDLDLSTLQFLETFIRDATIPIIFISHDETLLEHCANRILHIEQLKHKQESRWTLANVDYTTYRTERISSFALQESSANRERSKRRKKEEILQKIKNKVEYQQDQCVRNPTMGRLLKKKMHVIKSQEKKLEKETLTPYPLEEETISLLFDQITPLPSSKKIIDLHLESLEIRNQLLATNLHLSLYGPKKIGIIGQNGVGKTTFLQVILTELKKTPSITVGYFPQNYSDVLPLARSPVEHLHEILGFEKTIDTQIRTFLGVLHFRKEEMLQPMKSLSGGQRAKIVLLSLVLLNPNVLVLDEPTRNLSPLSLPTIRLMLKQFPGAIIAVSHDRKLLSYVFETIYELKSDGLYQQIKEDFRE